MIPLRPHYKPEKFRGFNNNCNKPKGRGKREVRSLERDFAKMRSGEKALGMAIQKQCFELDPAQMDCNEIKKVVKNE